jgi:hypothetical protein
MKSAIRVKSNLSAGPWAVRAVSVYGVTCTVLIIAWATDFSPIAWWQQWRVHRPKPIAQAVSLPLTRLLGPVPPAPKGNDTSISKVPLDLLLVRVIPGATAHEGTAEIGVYRDSPQTLQSGAVLENGARLSELYPDHVVLKKDGHSVNLYLERLQRAPLPRSPLLTVGGTIHPLVAKATSREMLTDYLRPSPVYDGATFIGLKVFPGRKPGPFQQMGLTPGDVITEIDGAPLTDMATAWEQVNQLSKGDSLTVRVRRGDTVNSMTLDGSLVLAMDEAPPPIPPLAMQMGSGQ